MDILSGQHSPHELVRLTIANDLVTKVQTQIWTYRAIFFTSKKIILTGIGITQVDIQGKF